MVKILYLHNKDNWALHNVGKLWFKNLPPHIFVDMLNYHSVHDGLASRHESYDFIWFGYLHMYMQFNYNPDRSIVSVHDPMELFPQVKDWKIVPPIESSLSALRSLKHISTVSCELQEVLKNHGIFASRISTTSLSPLRDVIANVLDSRPVVISVANIYPRKQLNLLYKLGGRLDELGIRYEFKIGPEVLPEDEYIKKLDAGSIYICTSFQEGGPLPAMDAMARGCIILTTPVGQMLELVEDGVNGFFCNSEDDFLSKVIMLMNDKKLFGQMRMNAIRTMSQKRSKGIISSQVAIFLKTLSG
jgi:glycosyltransferase involved in cell wall biosynthesis